MENNDVFVTEVTKHFQFLEEEYGMRRDPMQVGTSSAWVPYSSPNVRVIVEHELGGYCGVTIQNLRHIKRDPLERGEFDLEEIVAVGGQRPQRRPDARSLSEAVSRAAQTLRTVGGTVLKGDFEALETRQKKAVEALRRHNPLGQEKEPAK